MHEGHHGILDETKKSMARGSVPKKHVGHGHDHGHNHGNDQEHDHDHGHDHQNESKANPNTIKIVAGVVVALVIIAAIIWKLQA